MNAAVKGVGHLGIDLPAKSGQAAKGRLDVAAGAAETVVEIEVAQGGVDVVEPHQAHHPAAKPDAFRVSGRAIDGLRRFDKFVGLALIVLGRVRRRAAFAAAGLPDWSWARLSPLWAEALPMPISSASAGTARWRKTAF